LLRSFADRAPSKTFIRSYGDVETMLAAHDAPDAVAICTPPSARYDIARFALACGKHVLLEKPPCATVQDVEDLLARAKESGKTLFCAWHSKFAPAVRPAREWLVSREVRRVRIVWHEDVRIWHPGQQWIWKSGGFGVFDAGINALSIATAILPRPFQLREAWLRIPANRETPIAAELAFSDAADMDMTASFNWLHEGRQTWEIDIETSDGHLLISEGGGRLSIDGTPVQLERSDEYRRLYEHFAALIEATRCDVDLIPFQLVTQALLNGRREAAPPFFESSHS
jgi:D-galactose 1-dehydrogenase